MYVSGWLGSCVMMSRFRGIVVAVLWALFWAVFCFSFLCFCVGVLFLLNFLINMVCSHV